MRDVEPGKSISTLVANPSEKRKRRSVLYIFKITIDVGLLDCGGSKDIEIPQWNNTQREQSTFGKKDITEGARIGCASSWDNEAVEALVEVGIRGIIHTGVDLGECDGQVGIERVRELKGASLIVH